VLGATEIVPLTTLRTNVPVRRADSGRLHERWQRVAIAAAKQCGRASLPMLADVKGVADVWQTPAWATWQRRMLVAPTLPPDRPAIVLDVPGEPAAGVGQAPLVMAVGPEGGWDDTELEHAVEAGWTPWSLGPCTLRAEHVTLAALAIVRYAWPRR
jgi:16S rRNA (uracil1498-N3)-methyltransferase